MLSDFYTVSIVIFDQKNLLVVFCRKLTLILYGKVLSVIWRSSLFEILRQTLMVCLLLIYVSFCHGKPNYLY